MAKEPQGGNHRAAKRKLNVTTPPQILGSPRPVKGRTSGPRRNSWKDVHSTHSSMTTQTVTSMTDMSSSNSISHSSPASHEERPKVVLHMQNMDPKFRSGIHLDANEEAAIPEDDNGSDASGSRSSDGDGEGSEGEMSLRSGGSSRRDDSSRWSASNNNSNNNSNRSRRSVSSGGSSSRRSLRSNGESSMGSSIIIEAQGVDSAASYPKRRPTLEEEDQESQRKLQVDEECQYNDDDESDESEDSNRSEDDKLSPLMDPVSLRLQKLDDRQRVPGSSQQSDGTASFSASYGSVSLGGEASLSSEDTFRNSPGPKTKRVSTIPSQPDLQAQPQKKILKQNDNPNPNPIEWSRQRFRAEENYYRNPLDDTDDSDAQSSSSRVSSSPAESFSSRSSASSSCWNESLKSFSGTGNNLKITRRRSSGLSVDSGNVSIATYSDGGSTVGGSDNISSSSGTLGIKQQESLRSATSSSKGDKRSKQSTSIGSSIVEESWDKYAGRAGAAFSISTDGEEKKGSKDGGNGGISIKTPRSYSSWTSSDEWSTPREASAHWASQNWSQRHGDVSAWTSGDDSSASTDSDVESVSEDSAVSPPLAKEPRPVAKPRSALDKNAPWYCGEDGDDADADDLNSMNSDSSSILSGLKKQKSPKKPAALLKKMEQPSSDGSMSFAALAKPLSMSLTDLGPASDQEKEAEVPLEESMSFGELIDVERGLPASAEQDLAAVEGPSKSKSSLSPGKKKKKRLSNKKVKVAAALTNEEDISESPASVLESGEVLADESSKSMREYVEKVFDYAWCRRALYIGLAVFLLFDIILVALLLTK